MRTRVFATVATAALLSVAAPAPNPGLAASATLEAPLDPELAREPLDEIVATHIFPQLDYFFERLQAEGEDLTLDGVKAFSGKDKFLPGKIAVGLAHLIVGTGADDPKLQRYLTGYRRIAELTIDDTNESWGIYYYVSALYRLERAGYLRRAVDDATLARLRAQLDWRSFVNESDMTLIDLPTNYYGVAFSIARLRHLLGWEDEAASRQLLDKMLAHYGAYSGEHGFSDETNGEGRFDRYSVLLIGEICQRFIETGLEPTQQMRDWLRNSVDVMKLRFNEDGDGFSYGRSLGPYGDTAFLEVLSAAAYLGVLDEEEAAMAYAFSTRVTAKYVDFWFDDGMRSVNMWEHGRSTDGYRGKHRILGENFSLTHQLIYTSKIWSRAGFTGRQPSGEFVEWLDALPRTDVTWFARGEYDRALITFRDGSHVISLPLINGGAGQHMNNPYYPIPFANRMLEGTPDESYPQLLPRFHLADGSDLIPAVYLRDIEADAREGGIDVSYRQDALDRLGEKKPIADPRLTVETRYELVPGRIVRSDTFVPSEPLDLEGVEIVFAGFSQHPTVNGAEVTFGSGDVSKFSARGFDDCSVETLESTPPYLSPVGPMRSLVRCALGPAKIDGPLELGWTLSYR